jgi:AraC family transcriptional regulator
MTIRCGKMANTVMQAEPDLDDTVARTPAITHMTRPQVVDYPPGSSFGPRTLVDHEFVWLLGGSARWTTVDQVEDLRPGQLMLLRPGMRDLFSWDRAAPTRHAFIHFSTTAGLGSGPAGEPETRESREAWPLLRRIGGADDPLEPLCEYLLWLAAGDWDDTRPRATATLGFLLATYVGGPLPGSGAAPLPPAVEAVAERLRAVWADGIARPLTLADVAAAASLSTVQVTRIFRAAFGIGPVGAVELLRLARAEPLLLRSNLTIAEIGRLCGFPDPYHFSRRFRAAYGVAPRVFRRDGGVATAPLATGGLLHLQRLVQGEP